jgi:hypothetical protein
MTESFKQGPTDKLDYTVDFDRHCTRFREPGTAYALGDRVRPKRSTGVQYRATTAGVTGTDEPRWPTNASASVKDGSVVWAAEAIGNASLRRTLSSSVWTPDSGLTVTGKVDGTTGTTAFVSGGTIGQVYDVAVEGTFSDGSKLVAVLRLAIERREVGASV